MSSIDPRRTKHRFRKASYNPFFCGYCSAPAPAHQKCGHSVHVDGCSGCHEAIFSAKTASFRRRRNLRAMQKRGITPGGSRP